jgi:hypothetical protein
MTTVSEDPTEITRRRLARAAGCGYIACNNPNGRFSSAEPAQINRKATPWNTACSDDPA